MQKALVLSSPFLFQPHPPGYVGGHPVDSDIFYHFGNAFSDLGWEAVFPAWKMDQGCLIIDEAASLAQMQQAFDQGCERLIVFTDVNFLPTADNNEGRGLRLAQSLRERYGQRVRVVTFIPDAYLKARQVEILEACARVAHIILSPYSAIAAVLELLRLPHIKEKVCAIAAVPTRFFADLFVIDPNEHKVFDVCFIGSLDPKKILRASAMQILIAIEGIRLFISSAGRTPMEGNPTRQIADFLRVYCSSAYSVCATAMPQSVVANVHDTLLLYQPPAFPGRVAESIACGCLPLYVRENEREVVPLPQTRDNFPYVDILPETMAKVLPEMIENRRLGLAAPLAEFRDYHARHLSAQAVLQPVIEELWRR